MTYLTTPLPHGYVRLWTSGEWMAEDHETGTVWRSEAGGTDGMPVRFLAELERLRGILRKALS